MKFKQCGVFLLTLVVLAPAMTVPASAKVKLIPKSMRGTWVTKPQYNSKPHINKNMWLPSMKLVVYKKTAKWQMKGYLPADAGYDHKVHTIRAFQYRKDLVTLHGDSLFTKWNFLSRQGKKLDFGQQRGSDIFMTRAK
ncbi:hypothetical protein [Levilactobacillus cerevisiae]|uniref:hypothetical protein n=1 Tax=Levilactobacillus cerevisiae TaxID=1704076 RepID=UPI000F7B532C|nr:hypothetical protein [Levilactobacillus cerevisiae]